MGIWNSIARMGGAVMTGTGKTMWNFGKAATGQAAKTVIHPVNTIKNAGNAMKTVAIGGGAAYVGWETLTTDKSVARVVGDTLVGSDTVDQVKGTMDDVKELKTKAGEAVDTVGDALSDMSSQWNGIGTFLQGMTSGQGGNMISNFFSRLGSGKVSGLSIAGLVASAFLIFGRTGFLGKIAGAMLAMMMIGNNSNVQARSVSQEIDVEKSQEETERSAMRR